MTNILAILVLVGGFKAAVEVDGGIAERDFANTNVGVEEFLAWARPAIEKEGRPVKVCTVTLAEDPGRVMQWLLENDIGPALLSSHAYRSYATANQLNDSARTVATACLSNFPFLRKVGG